MAKTSRTRSGVALQLHLLTGVSRCLGIIQAYAPGISFNGVRLLVFVAEQTADRTIYSLPKQVDIAKRFGLTQAGASRLIASLTSSGRKGKRSSEDDNSGFGLIETDDWIEGRRSEVYVLTEKGRQCVRAMLEALTEESVEDFNPHDIDSLFKLLFEDWRKRKTR